MILVLGGHASGSAADGPYPGLPRQTGGFWLGAAQGGVSEAAKARQWARVPMQALAAYNVSTYKEYRPQPDPLGRSHDNIFTPSIYFVSPPGSEHNYGMSPQFAVRTVAFGAIPVEATLQLIQRRNADDQPIPIVAEETQTTFYSGLPNQRTEFGDTRIEDAVTLRVTRLVVDGFDLGLGNRCQTAEPGALSLLGKGWRPGVDNVVVDYPWVTGNYVPANGGLLVGSVDVPAFTGCLTSGGEDVSRLLTSTVSGPGNAVRLHVSGIGACQRPEPPATSGTGAPRPGESTPEAAGCDPAYMPPEVPIP